MRDRHHRVAGWLTRVMGVLLLASGPPAPAGDLPEYRLKAAFLYNFALFTEWPPELGTTLNLCVLGKDPFGTDLDPLAGKALGQRHIAIHRAASIESLGDCQLVFIARSALATLPSLLEHLHGSPVLTVADSPGAAARGVALNMTVNHDKITFEANLEAARAARLNLSSKLLRLATEVQQ